MSTLLDDALSRSLRTASRGFTYRELSENRIQSICFLIHCMLFDNQPPEWELFEIERKPVSTPETEAFIERWTAK